MRAFRPPLPVLAVSAVLCGALALAGPDAAAAQSAVDRELVSLEFQGNEAFSDDDLGDAILTRSTRCRAFIFQPFCFFSNWGFAHDRSFLDESVLPADLLRLRLFYRRRGFRAVRVDTLVARHNGKAEVTFDIEEGPPTRVSSLEIRGIEGILDTAGVRRGFPLAEGAPFDLVALNEGKRWIVELLRERGYIEATVLDEYFIPADTREAELMLDVEPGPRARIGEIHVEGSERLRDEVVHRALAFESSDVYRESRIRESQRELFRLDAVRFAELEPRLREEADTLVDVHVRITPAVRRSVRTGIGATTTDCMQTEAQFIHRNFLGDSRRLQLTGRLSNIAARQLGGNFPCSDVGADPVFQELNFTLRADFRQPYIFSARNRLEWGFFLEREAVPNIFVRNSRGGELSMTRMLRRRMPLTLAVRPELTSFDRRSADVFFCINFGFCQPEDIDAVTASRWLSPVSLSWRYDRTDAPFSPTRGYYLSKGLEGAFGFTGSDFRYTRFNVEAANFEQLTSDLVLGTRIRTGFVAPTAGPFSERVEDEIVHPRKRFFAGGAQSVRGFGQNLLGPTVLVFDAQRECGDEPLDECAAALPPDRFDERPSGGNAAFEVNLELRTRVSESWTVVGFLDAGQVWEDLGRLEAPVATPGLGVRFASPVGPLRLDVGYNPRGTRLLPAVAQLPDGELQELDERVRFNPFTFPDADGNPPGTLREFWRRLQLHISIGEAF